MWTSRGHLPTSLCSPFMDHTSSVLVVKVVIGLVSAEWLTSYLFDVIVYILLVMSLTRSQAELQGIASKQQSSKAMFLQILILLFLEKYPVSFLCGKLSLFTLFFH